LAAALERVEADPGRRLEPRPLLQPHPGLGDHAEDALGADQKTVRTGTGAGPRESPALPGPRRRDRAHRLDQVVDMRVERGEVAAGPGGDPAAECRVLERLGEVPQREALLAQLVL